MKLPFRRKHVATYKHVNVNFAFTFDLGSDSVRKTSSKLLNAGIADLLVDPFDGAVKLSPSYKKLAKTRADALAISSREGAVDSWNYSGLSRRGKFLIWKTFVFSWVRRVLMRRPNSGEKGNRSDPATALREVMDTIDSSMRELRFRPLLQDAVDRKLYQGAYLMTRPFIRLQLRPARVAFVSPIQGALSKEVWVTIVLLLHFSGTAILTFDVDLPAGMDSNELLPMLSAGESAVSTVVLSEPVLDNMIRLFREKKSRLMGEWEDELKAGVRWRRIELGDEGSSVVELFETYRDAILNVLRPDGADPVWFCYPTVFIGGMSCCGNRDRWMKNHSLELVSLTNRSDFGADVRGSSVGSLLGNDYSLTADRSFYANSGLALDLRWKFNGESKTELVDRFHRTILIENSLLKYWRLRILDSRLRSLGGREASAVRLQQGLIRALADYGQRVMSYGTAEDISADLARQFAGELYSELRDQIDMMGQLVNSERTEVAARRANRFAGTALLVAIFLGLPGIRQSLEVLQKVGEPWSGFPIVQSIQNGSLSSDLVLLYVYVGLVVLLVMLFLYDRIRRIGVSVRRKRIRSTVGYEWPGQDFNVTLTSGRDGSKRSARASGAES